MDERSLHEFVEEVSGRSHLRVEHDFGDGFVRLHTSEAERRQAAQDIQCTENIVLELLRNSRDAHASHIFLATGREGNARQITVVDDGDGIPPTMHAHVFEPRVTSKLDTSHMDSWGLHGRGMALFSIAENVADARVASSDVGLGCAMVVESDVSRLPEKTDQSKFPTFIQSDDGTVNVRGPRNILRTACEFAIAERNTCSVYVGSSAEVAATMYEYGASTISKVDRIFCSDATELPFVKRLALACDPEDFANTAALLGLTLSTRTARRIMGGQVSVLDPILERITIQAAEPRRAKAKARSPRSAARFTAEERTELADGIRSAFAPLAERYYLDPDIEPRVSASQGKLTVTIPLVEPEERDA